MAASPAPLLLTPYPLRSLTARNRIVMSPMCQYSATDGLATDWHLVHLGSRAVGGVGTVLVEATAVTPEGRISPGCLGIWDDAHVAPLAAVAAMVRRHGAIAGIQLAHAGRKGSVAVPWRGGRQLALEAGGWQTFAPSAVPFHPDDRAPAALTVAEIGTLIRAFEQATHRALSAGFELIELHAAHGYLLHEFLSPLSNHRTDDYGGSFANRTRLLCEVVTAVRAIVPAALPLWVRISATDWADGGWDVDQSVALARQLSTLGVDLIDVSSGGLTRAQQILDGPGYQVPFAARVRREGGVASGAVGRIVDPAAAEAILQRGDADVILLARALLRDPYWPMHAARALGAAPPWPEQYLRAES